MIRAALLAAAVAAAPAAAQEARVIEGPDWSAVIAPVSGFTGEMSMTMEVTAPEDMAVTEVIRFEPWQILDELFRDDLVFVMRAGPSDWDAAEDEASAPMDCAAQRPLSDTGTDEMRQFGALVVVNDLRPGKVLASERCRAQATWAAMERGMAGLGIDTMDGMQTDLDPRLTLGAGGDALMDAVMEWDGGDGDGPLLLITHFSNIEAATRFRVYEGEMLILDPKREGRVLGYLRLASARPDAVRYPADVVARRAAVLGE
ncbi:hypothetical protein JQC91_08135 [Jannaschia sp. Os4]|uniref:hypothetical protein n=1 Tax=Jannaschia sp. Os4 TaxID=2807617 RepID=UPI00193AD030|nr:hypothetical protein [Jannaschia sp. Os4]MBM2576272.1 hypothetical protein [Jannaschia sp. Os4]